MVAVLDLGCETRLVRWIIPDLQLAEGVSNDLRAGVPTDRRESQIGFNDLTIGQTCDQRRVRAGVEDLS